MRRGRESQTDTLLDIIVADGDSAYNFAVVNSTLAAGSAATDHMSIATAAMYPYGVLVGYMPQVTSNPLQAAGDGARPPARDRENRAGSLI